MAGKLNFTRNYAMFGSDVRDFEKAPDVVSVLARTVCDYEYPYDVYIDEKFVSVWLREDEPGPNDPDNLDLIFIAKNQGFAEVVLRDHGDAAVYGGYLIWGDSAEVTDEIVNGYRVINVNLGAGGIERHEFVLGFGYAPVGPAATASLARSKRGPSYQ